MLFRTCGQKCKNALTLNFYHKDQESIQCVFPGYALWFNTPQLVTGSKHICQLSGLVNCAITGMPLEKELLVTSVFPVVFQWSSSDLPEVFQCVPIMQINTGLPFRHHWVLASASVVSVAFQCTCGSSGLPVCSNYANEDLWIVTGRPMVDNISQCDSSVVCPVVSQCTDRIWFGGH